MTAWKESRVIYQSIVTKEPLGTGIEMQHEPSLIIGDLKCEEWNGGLHE